MHIPFSFVLTLLTLALSCVPAVLIWVVFSNLTDNTTNMLYATSTTSINGLSNAIQDLLLRNSLALLDSRITAGNIEAMSQEVLLHATGLIDMDLRPNVTDINTQVLSKLASYNFNTMKGNQMLSYISMEGQVFDSNGVGKTVYWIVWQVLNIDIGAVQAGRPPYHRTLYLCTVQLSKDGLWNDMTMWYPDQTTGAPLGILAKTTYPWQGFGYTEKLARASWSDDLYVNPYSGQVELTYVKTVAAGNKLYDIGLGLNTQTLSEELRAQLADKPTDRLFIFFRNRLGHLIAASHGKYFSLSDVDSRYVNPLLNPPNLSQYRLYTCLDSTDALILDACQQLVGRFRNWTRIPESRQDLLLRGRRYWVAVGYSNSSLKATVVLLSDRQAVMGSIDASSAEVTRGIAAKRGTSATVLGVATAGAALLPLLMGLWLGRRLLRLASGMDRIAKLDFTGPSVPTAMFKEIHDFQQSFLKMERGLRAFGQFVPSAVVTRLVAGRLTAEGGMEAATLTVLFADVEGFSTVAETVPPAQLAEVCTEYFEVMCSTVVQREGTIDKFIGDCVMALWNAPLPRPHHERSAVTASLAMQAAVLGLHEEWRRRGLPTLRFRLGLHTGKCLVGNFGCSHRVSYTCLGDSVNLAARLEALNKKFGTVLCVSQAVHAACRADFHFCHLARVTVPGRSEVLSVYEVLCAADADAVPPRTPPKPPLPKSPTSLSDVSPRLTKPMLEDLCLESLDTPKAGPPGSLLRDLLAPGKPCLMVEEASTVSSDDARLMPYHWALHDHEAVLQAAAEYEAAYAALAAGRPGECRRLVAARSRERMWRELVRQLDQQAESNEPWDGVLYFREK